MGTGKKEKLEAALQRVRAAYHERIVAELQDTRWTYKEIALNCGVSEALVYTLSRIHKLSRSRTAPEQLVDEKE
jgi:hypothetical protein